MNAQEREAESAESHLTLRLFGQMLGRIEDARSIPTCSRYLSTCRKW